MPKKGKETHQDKAIALRIAGRSYQQIADEIGVCKRTVAGWFTENDAVMQRYEDQKNQYRNEYNDTIIPLAMAKLQEIMESKNPFAALQAIQLYFSRLAPSDNSGADSGGKANDTEIHVTVDSNAQ